MSQQPRLPGTASEEQIVCHVDMDCFYASCERLREPALRGEPVVVGMGYEPGATDGAVATASYEAREYGVESAQAVSQALDRLPRKVDAATTPELSVDDAGFYRPVDMEFYESVAADVKAILHEWADVVREVSIDEAYLDVTGRTDWENVGAYARRVKDAIATEVGVTASIGVAPSMSGAKVASDHDKPDGLVVVKPGTVAAFLAPLDVEAVHGIGPKTATALEEMGIETAGDLAAADPTQLEAEFGERGLRIHRFASGNDTRAVTPRDDPKSLSRESAFTEPTSDSSAKRERIRTLAESLSARVGERDVLYATIGIKVVTPPFDVHTRAQSLSGPVADPALLEDVALSLLGEFDDDPVRKLGVRVSNLSFTEGDQPTLDAWGDDSEQDGSDRQSTPEVSTRRGQRSLTEFEPE